MFFVGTHWSLLALFPQAKRFIAMDSMLNMNQEPTNGITSKMSELLFEKESKELGPDKSLDIRIHFRRFKQEGHYDCGVFVIANARAILEYFFRGKKDQL